MSGDNEFAGHTKNILTADFKRTKPYRITTGGEDFNMCFFDGPPFKLVSNKKEHSNFVSCIRYNLDSTQFASTGFDKKINIWDVASNEVLYSIESTVENGHTASIISLLWIDNNTILTNSVDKTCKVWDLETKSVKYTLLPVEKDKLTQDQIGCGIVYSAVLKKIISLNLNGQINIWNQDTLEDGKLPDMVLTGHQNSVYHIRYSKQMKKIVSCDSNGYFCNINFYFIKINLIYFFYF
jgi:WD40 repeat protein